ncbi:MAG: MoaD/ThiS family protein [Planctomycetaceae bacterium]
MTERCSTVEIILEAPLSSLAGSGTISLPISGTSSLLDVLQQLSEAAPAELKPRILRVDGSPVAGLLFFLNNRPVAAGNAGQTTVQAGDVLLLCPPISGG